MPVRTLAASPLPTRRARLPRLSRLLVLAPLVIAAATACGDSSSAAGSGTAPALTKAQAAQVLDRYTTVAAKATQGLDATALAAIETGPQLAMDTAAFKLRKAAKHHPPAVAFTKPAFYIPRMDVHPRWFAVDVTTRAAASQKTSGKASAPSAPGSPAGPGTSGADALRHALIFTQATPGAPWLLAADPYVSEASFDKIALDGQGYATPVQPDDGEPAVQPVKLPTAHAALLSDGPQAPGADILADGPRTRQAYDALRQAQTQLKPAGVTLTSRFAPEPGPVHALRTKDGGALVWYVIRQNEAYSSPKRGKLAVTGDLVGLAPASAAKTRLDTTVLVQYLAAVPSEGKASVTGMYRKAVSAVGS